MRERGEGEREGEREREVGSYVILCQYCHSASSATTLILLSV